MKKITKSITLRQYGVRCYNHETDSLENYQIIKTGEKPLLDKKISKNLELLRVIEASEPITKKYSMDIKAFENIAIESNQYMYGFINRKIGGELATCKVYDLETDEVKTINIENETEKRLEKKLLENNYKLIKIESVNKVDEKYYYLSDETFAANSDEGLPEFEMYEVL